MNDVDKPTAVLVNLGVTAQGRDRLIDDAGLVQVQEDFRQAATATILRFVVILWLICRFPFRGLLD